MMINLNMDNMPAVLQQLTNKIASLILENAILNATLESIKNENNLEEVSLNGQG